MLSAYFKDVVFNQLLGNGTAAASVLTSQYAYCCTGNRPEIDSVVGPETGILNSYKGINQILRKLVVAGLFPVGAGHDQGICQVSGAVINSSCVTGGDDTVHVQFWSAVNNAHKHACTHTDSYDQAEGTQNQTGFKESKKNPGGVFSAAGTGSLYFFFGCFFSVIHFGCPPLEIIAKKSSYYYTKNGNALQESLIPVMMEPAVISMAGQREF